MDIEFVWWLCVVVWVMPYPYDILVCLNVVNILNGVGGSAGKGLRR